MLDENEFLSPPHGIERSPATRDHPFIVDKASNIG
jgi:hypothetical protein